MGPNRHEGLLHPFMIVDILTSQNDIRKANMILDSGASVSVVHSSLLEGVRKSTRRITERRFVTASGENIGNGLFATFECVVGGIGKKIKVVDALIINTKESGTKQILLGSQDLRKAGIVLDFYRGLIRFEAGVRKVIPMEERPVKEVMRIMEDTSRSKLAGTSRSKLAGTSRSRLAGTSKLSDVMSSKVREPTDFCMKWLEHEKSEESRNRNVILTGNSVRYKRGDNTYAKVAKAKVTGEKNENLAEKQRDRYKVERIVEGGRVMRGIDKDAVGNRYNVKIAQIVQRDGDEEAVEKDRYECSGVHRDKVTSEEMSIRNERGVDKDTVDNRNNVDLTQDVDKDAVRYIDKRQKENHKDRYNTNLKKKGVQGGRVVDKETAKGRYNVDRNPGFSKDAVQKNKMDGTSVKRQVASSKGTPQSFESSNVAVRNLTQEKSSVMIGREIDARSTYKRRMDKELEVMRNEFTIGDVEFDQNFLRKHPESRGKLIKIMERHKLAFQNTVGCAPKRYEILAKIEGKGSMHRQDLTVRTPKEVEIMARQLDEDFRDGVLVFPDEHGIIVENLLQMMLVEKKTDDGKVQAFTNARLVVACNQRVNKISRIPAFETDSLAEVSQKAALASIHPWKMKFDIKKAFPNIPMHKSMWGHFGVTHPHHGIMVYTRCCMGWVGSMGLVRNAFLQIFAKFRNNMFRYMDDGFLFADSEGEFFELFEEFLKCIVYNNLRIKGSKLKMFLEEMNFLGTMIKAGRIFPSPHQKLKALESSPNTVRTVSDLRSFLGLCQFLARFMHRSTDVFSNLRKWLGKDGKLEIPWDDNEGFLRKEFGKVLRALQELTHLRPFDVAKQAYIFIDTSAKGSGAILAQKDELGNYYVVEFYSRKRLDAERKMFASSCILELSGLVGACNFWRHYLESAVLPTIVFTDSASLTAIAKRFADSLVPSTVVTINKFFRDLLGLRLQVHHLAGTSVEIGAVDIISRTENAECDLNSCSICQMAYVEPASITMFVRSVHELCEGLKSKWRFHKAEESCVYMVNEDKHTVEFRRPADAFDVTCAVTQKAKGIRRDVTCSSISEGKDDYMASKQRADPVLRKAIKLIESGEVPPPKTQKHGMRLSTIVNTKKAYVKNGMLQYDKWISKLSQRLAVVFVPEPAAGVAMSAVHNEFGCKSPTQFLQMFERHFELANAKTFIDSFLRQCTGCILLRQENVRKPLAMKEVKPPERVGEVVYIDEIQRQGRKGPVRILFATDGLSRFGVAEKFDGSLTSEMFISFVLHVKNVLCALNSEKSNVICRTDGASAHTSKKTKECLEKAGVELEVHESTTCSKNVIPAQDVRIRALQKFLVVAFNDKDSEIEYAIHWAVRMYNQSICNLGFAPAELFHRRKLGTQADIGVSDEWVKTRVKEIRQEGRDNANRRNDNKRKKKRLQVIPYDDVFLNSGEMLEKLDPERQLLKEGNCVKLHKTYDKTDLNRMWKVKSIDWESKTFVGVKVNMGTRGKAKTWSLEAIDQVLDESSKILAVLSEQQVRRRRAAKGISELFGEINQYSVFSTELGHIGDMENRVMIDDSGVFSPEGALASPATLISYEMDENNLRQEIYPVASTPLSGDFVPETPQSPESDIELTLPLEADVSMASSGLNESDLDDTIQGDTTVQKVAAPRRSGRKTNRPDRLVYDRLGRPITVPKTATKKK